MKTIVGCIFSLLFIMALVPSSEQQGVFYNPYLSSLDQPDLKGARAAAFIPFQKKWSRLEPSIRFFKRSSSPSENSLM